MSYVFQHLLCLFTVFKSDFRDLICRWLGKEGVWTKEVSVIEPDTKYKGIYHYTLEDNFLIRESPLFPFQQKSQISDDIWCDRAKSCQIYPRGQCLLYLKKSQVFSSHIIDRDLKFSGPESSFGKTCVFQNKLQHLLFKVWEKHVKAGVEKVFQHPLSIFKHNCGCYNSFSKPEMKLEGLMRALGNLCNTCFEIWRFYRIYTSDQKPMRWVVSNI